MKPMNVLSAFDGDSGGMMALERAGIPVKNYYASEIDKYASAASGAMYPDIIRLGDVMKWQEWDLPQIDLLIGGSPCQSFSIAGKRNGMSMGNIDITSLEQYQKLKANGVKFDGQSYLFWEYVAILRHYKPKYFLLENVDKIEQRWKTIITRNIGINPILINSALVSAQNRKRLYWTNIGATKDLFGNPVNGIRQPKDKGILLKDILDDDVCEPVLSNVYGGFGEDKPREHFGKSVTIRANSGGGSIPSVRKKSQTVLAKIYKENAKSMLKRKKYGLLVGGAIRGRYTDSGTEQQLELRNDDKSNCLTTVQKDSVLVDVRYKSKPLRIGGGESLDRHELDSIDDLHIRKLSVTECARLQTLPDNFVNVARSAGISNTQLYKMIGNGWTIDVIAHILKGMFNE